MGFFKRFIERSLFIIRDKRAELDLRGTAIERVLDKTAEVIISGTTYIVSSFFKKDAKGNAIDKIRRLIERDTETDLKQ